MEVSNTCHPCPCHTAEWEGILEVSVSCADSLVPIEASRWPAQVLGLPGRAETRSEEGRVWGTEDWDAGLQGLQRYAGSQVVGLRPTQKPQQRQEECSLWCHTISPELRQTTQAVRGTDQTVSGWHRAPERAGWEQYLHRAWGEGSLKEAGAGRLTGFHFLPLFPLFFRIFYSEDIFGDIQVFIYSGKMVQCCIKFLKIKLIQIASIHKLKTEREGDGVWVLLYPKFLKQSHI